MTEASIAAAGVVHQRFAAILATALTRLLRASVAVDVAGVECGIRSRLGGSRPGHGFSARLSTCEPRGSVDLHLGHSFVHPAIDLLLGGCGRNEITQARPLTQVERRLLGIVLDCCARSLGEAWSAAASVDFCVESPGESTHVSPPADPREPLIVVRLGAAFLGRSSEIALWIPPAFDQLIREARPGDLDLEVRAVLGRTTLAAAQLAGLAAGDVLTTPIPAGTPVTLEVEGQPEFHGIPGLFRGQRAVRVIAPRDAVKKSLPLRRNKGCD